MSRAKVGKCAVVPSGFAAVEGRNTLKRSQMLDADLRYVHAVSLWTDLAILARTVPVVLLRRGFHADDESEEFVEDIPPDPAPA